MPLAVVINVCAWWIFDRTISHRKHSIPHPTPPHLLFCARVCACALGGMCCARLRIEKKERKKEKEKKKEEKEGGRRRRKKKEEEEGRLN